MQHENEDSTNKPAAGSAEVESSEGADLKWLIDQEYSEEPEKLFTILEEEALDCSLSPLETEMAARPMTRGNRGLDDLSTYVGEEIVLGSADSSSDIYDRSDSGAVQPVATADVPMAIDHKHFSASRNQASSAPVDEGLDILGLSEEDDIGEQFLVIKKRTAAEVEAISSAQGASQAAQLGAQEPEQVTEATALDEPEQVDPSSEQIATLIDAVDHEEAVETAAEQPTEVELALEPVAMQTAGDVIEYVSSTQPPLDDAGFDQYLLDGEHLAQADDCIDELMVESTDGIPSVDPTPTESIDYHADFAVENGLDSDSVAAISLVISSAMEELSLCVSERLEQLKLQADAVKVELMLGADADAVACCLAQGYVQVATICSELPTALAELGQTEIDAVYVRLLHEDSGEHWNDLLEENFCRHQSSGSQSQGEAEAAQPWSLPFLDDDARLDDLEDDFGFAEGLDDLAIEGFAIDPVANEQDSDPLDEALSEVSSDGFESTFEPVSGEQLEASDESELDDALTNPSQETVLSESDDELQQPAVVADSADQPMLETGATATSTSTSTSTQADEDGDEADSVENATRASQEEAASSESESIEPLAQTVGDFEEDIFGPDFADDFDPQLGSASTDLDALLDSLTENETEGDDICGIAVDEFSTRETLAARKTLDTQETPEAEVQAEGEAALDSSDDLSWCIPADIKFDFTSQSQSEIFVDFLDAFIEEAASGLEQLEDAMAAWEADVTSDAAFAPIPRILHTLKGIAKGVGLQRYGTLIHNYETLLERLARPEPGAELRYFRIVNVWLDTAVSGFEHIQETRSDVASEFPTRGAGLPIADAAMTELSGAEHENAAETPADAIAAGEQDQSEEPSEDASTASNVIPIHEGAERSASSRQKDMQLADEGAKVLAAKQSIRMTPETLDHLLNLTSQAQQLGVRSSQSTLRNKGAAAELQGRLSSVRAHIAKIADRALRNVTAKGNQSNDMDALEMDQYSELQEAASILREGVEDLDDLINHSIRQNAQVEALLKQQASVISFLGSSIQAARVVPVSRLMPGLRRIVRTVSSDLGKAVQFRVLNEVGSLDRDNHARCQVILEHMVRNALDHGIESPAERIAAGKPAAGRITIDVNKQGGDYLVELADDGRGIDPDVMRETAFDKGLDIDVDALSDEEAQQLIFHKGFSTAAALSEISGRGVGMDIVISELQQIGGDIDIVSVVGEGTTFRVRIPSNLILNGALLVSAGRASYAVPLDGLIAVEHVSSEVFYDAVENNRSISIFGMDCEPSYLATLCHGEGLPERGSWGATVPVIVAGSEERHMAVAIDDVKEALELVIRSLGVQFSMVPGVTGAATTADGQAIVALDLNALVASLAPEECSTISVEHRSDENLLVLVVDDSRTQRLVATSRFDTLGVETVTAENGMVAMEFLNSTHRLPDVILLDVEMPVKDGIQTLRDIRASTRLRELPVIMVTSRTGVKHRKLAEEAGCNGYMGKPFNFPVLVEMIAELTNRELQTA